MRRLLIAWGALGCVFLGSSDQALALSGLGAGISFGQGVILAPDPIGAADMTTLALSPTYTLTKALRAELALVAAMRGRRNGDFDLQLRPSIVVAPLGWPGYGRVGFGAVNLLVKPYGFMLSAALGSELVVQQEDEPLRLFAELGLLAYGDHNRAGLFAQHYALEVRVGGHYSLF